MPHESDAFIDALSTSLVAALPGYLPSRRWFGDKARTIASARILALVPINELEVPAAFAVIKVAFTEGPPSRYVLPVALTEPEREPSESIGSVEIGGKQFAVQDALNVPGFRAWLARRLIAGEDMRAGAGRLVIDRPTGAVDALERAIERESRVLGVEQSNSAIVYGSDVFIKLFRRLQTGINPDVELTRFLSVKAGFEHVPRFLGAMSSESTAGETAVVSVALAYVDSSGDGWSYLLDLIREHLDDPEVDGLLATSAPVARRLGTITADMHLALASDPWTPAFAPEPIGPNDVGAWTADYLAVLDQVLAGVRRAKPSLDERTQELAGIFLEIAPGLRHRASGFDQLTKRSKIRVHGDYHLGQILRRTDGDFVVIDFEGEPQRTIEERRRKTSPLKDVAGMLRSFSYARGAATLWIDDASGLRSSDLVAWERTMRREFLDTYVESAKAGNPQLLPASISDLQSALAAWELDKAVYEVLYELNNRPDWLWIPLSAMIKLGEPSS